MESHTCREPRSIPGREDGSIDVPSGPTLDIVVKAGRRPGLFPLVQPVHSVNVQEHEACPKKGIERCDYLPEDLHRMNGRTGH